MYYGPLEMTRLSRKARLYIPPTNHSWREPARAKMSYVLVSSPLGLGQREADAIALWIGTLHYP
jgi:hypothetical protein